MRYDSDPYIVKKLLTEIDILQISLDDPRLRDVVPAYLFDELEPFVSGFLSTLDHFAQLHTLNPQLSLSRFSATTLEQKLLTLQSSIVRLFSLKNFSSAIDRADWNKQRFLMETVIHDNEQLFVVLYKRIAQMLETYFTHRISQTHFAALINQVVGWGEHIERQGHHDIHAVILFAEKIARDRAVIEQRIDVVREICTLLQERSLLRAPTDFSPRQIRRAAVEISRIYSEYLLALYEALLEDMEIIAIAEQDFRAFEEYCHENQIEVYEEYHDLIQQQLTKYVEGIALYIPDAFRMIKVANLIVTSEILYERYKEVSTTVDILGINIAEDIRRLQYTVYYLREDYPKYSERYAEILHKVKRLKSEIVKPAIQVYSEYMKDPSAFFEKLPQHQSEWIPILESAMACLESDNDLYQKCRELKTRIDERGEKPPS